MRHGFVRAGEIAVLGATAPSPAWETVRPVTFGSDSDEQSGRIDCGRAGARRNWRDCVRSEEHTSELQSLMRISYAVFCLKKKKKRASNSYTTHTTNTNIL